MHACTCVGMRVRAYVCMCDDCCVCIDAAFVLVCVVVSVRMIACVCNIVHVFMCSHAFVSVCV